MRHGVMTARVLTALAGAALLGCVPDDPAPVYVGPLESCACDPELYPCGEFGTGACSLICDLPFETANDAAEAAGSEAGALALHDLYADESVVGILLFGTAGWCSVCGQEGPWLADVYDQYQDVDGAGHRVEFVAVVFQDDYGAPASREYATDYAARKGFPFPAVADTSGGVTDYFEPTAAPGNIFISRNNMTIQQVIQGFDQAELEQALRALDGSPACQ